jgi:hypothetical protein
MATEGRSSWAGIRSQRWHWGAVHLNVEANLTRKQQGEAFLGAIFEGQPNGAHEESRTSSEEARMCGPETRSDACRLSRHNGLTIPARCPIIGGYRDGAGKFSSETLLLDDGAEFASQ